MPAIPKSITLARILDYLRGGSRHAACQPEPATIAPPEPGACPDLRELAERGPLDAAYWCGRGRECQDSADIERAYHAYACALAVVHLYHPAVLGMRELAVLYHERARSALRAGDRANARELLARAIEADPDNVGVQTDLMPFEEAPGGYDLTRQCFVFHDAARATAVHREAVLRVVEYVSIAGVIGDILEFGVLGGWSARIFCETARRLRFMGRMHLFDSFEGLPEYASRVDRESYEISGRNLWQDRMRFPDDFVARLGGSVDKHIHSQLSAVLRAERIVAHRGFYSETLRQDQPLRAAVVHVDCDLYQSTVEVLSGLYRMNALQDGCVIMFDDWNCNKASPNYGERRAFGEFLEAQERFSSSAFFTYGFNGAAFFLHDRNA